MKKNLVALSLLAVLGAGCASQSAAPPAAPAPAPAPAQAPMQPAPAPAPAQQPAPSLQPNSPAPHKGPQTLSVAIINGQCEPQTEAIYVGDTISWTNKDTADRSVMGIDAALLWDSGNLKTGQTYKRTFTSAGTYNYRCSTQDQRADQIVVNAVAQ